MYNFVKMLYSLSNKLLWLYFHIIPNAALDQTQQLTMPLCSSHHGILRNTDLVANLHLTWHFFAKNSGIYL